MQFVTLKEELLISRLAFHRGDAVDSADWSGMSLYLYMRTFTTPQQ